MHDFTLKQVQSIAEFNPIEQLNKGILAKSVPMAKLKEFQRKITGYEIKTFSGGAKFRNGDILLAKITPCLENGKTAFVDILADNEIAFGSTEFIVLRAKNNTDPEFLYYFAISPDFRKRAIECMEGTSGRKRVNENTLKTLELPIPSYSTQQSIAAVLSALDQKIAINNQINAQLEQMAKTLYDYWFVQFDFPDENGKPYKSSGGEMVYNETLKREIPKGWEVKSLGEVISLERGVTYSKESVCSNHKNATGILRATNISGNIIDLNDLVFISDEIDNRQKLQPFDILIVMSSGSKEHIGKNGIYYFEQENAFGAFCSKIKPRNGYFEFVATFLQSSNFKGYIKNQCLGTNINNLNNSHILNCKIVSPANNIIDLFHTSTKSTYEKISCNAKQNQQLTQLRDFLLPMLMNGQVSINSTHKS